MLFEKLWDEDRRGVFQKKLDVLSPLADRLEDGKYGFRDQVASGLRSGRLPRGKGRSIVLDILAKQIGKPGTEEYRIERYRIDTILRQLLNR